MLVEAALPCQERVDASQRPIRTSSSEFETEGGVGFETSSAETVLSPKVVTLTSAYGDGDEADRGQA